MFIIWGCRFYSGVKELDFIGGIMNHKVYIDILKTNIHAIAQPLELSIDFTFMQDNDAKHATLNLRLGLFYNTPKILGTFPQLPGTNPIEHS